MTNNITNTALRCGILFRAPRIAPQKNICADRGVRAGDRGAVRVARLRPDVEPKRSCPAPVQCSATASPAKNTVVTPIASVMPREKSIPHTLRARSAWGKRESCTLEKSKSELNQILYFVSNLHFNLRDSK